MQHNGIVKVIITFSVMISLILFTSGCTENSKPDLTDQQISPSNSPNSTSSPQQLTSQPQIQDLTKAPMIIASTTVIPHFYGTISYGSNRSSALTEEQAWKYAAAYLRKIGIENIQPSEIVPLGQSIWKDKNDHEEIVWGFNVNRMVSGANCGGLITIDAYDGHVVDYAGYQ
nr:hypothetical protein [uncultured Methanoregula sp.]